MEESPIYVPIHLPRSQAIYGSLVETFEPYPQLYTRKIFNKFTFIITGQFSYVNTKHEYFLFISHERSW